MHSKEGVTKGDPLVMIPYGKGALPLIRELRNAHPRVTQPWYADDAGAGGTFQQVQEHFWYLQVRRPARGYYQEPKKSILFVALGNVAWAEEHFRGHGIRVVMRHRYLGGFIGDADAERGWLREKIRGWIESVKLLAGVAHKHPQSAYAGLKKSLQKEWDFVQRVTLGVRDAFGPVEEALREIFVPALYEGLMEGVPEREINRLTVKQAGLALPDPTQTAPENWSASCVITGHLVVALRV